MSVLDILDILDKKVRATDNIIVSVYIQGKRKFATINDGVNITKGEKVSYSEDSNTIIRDVLLAFAKINNKSTDYYKIIQDPYKDVAIREFGNGETIPYYLNNGCKIIIDWVGTIPNPDFNLGTYSTADDVPNASNRWLTNQIIKCNKDEAANQDLLPKSSWVDINGERDVSSVSYKSVKLYLPNYANDYIVYDNNTLVYRKNINTLKNFEKSISDYDIIKILLESYNKQVKKLYNIDYNLQLCVPDTNLPTTTIVYKNPIDVVGELIEGQYSNIHDDPVVIASTASAPLNKTKLFIEGLPDVIEIKANNSLDIFTVWAGSIPEVDAEFSDMEGLDPEYYETTYEGSEEQALEIAATTMLSVYSKPITPSSSYIPDTSSISTVTDPNAAKNLSDGYDKLRQYRIKDVTAGVYFCPQNPPAWFNFAPAPAWLKYVGANLLTPPVKADRSVYQYADHAGIDYNSDIKLLNKQEVKSVYDGEIVSMTSGGAGGYIVLVKHNIDYENKNYTFYTYYMHLSPHISGVTVGKKVKKGDVIGKVGNTGCASKLQSTHLHFEILGDIGNRRATTYDPVAVFGPKKING